MNRLDMLKFIQLLKNMSFTNLKFLKDNENDVNKLKLIQLELDRRIYASN